uniref:Gst14 n=1 Tax=Arundo donax TaxID=35708 RepID=A0A0A9B4I2_ARUDO
MFESRKNVSRWWYDISNRRTWQDVKSLQRPPSADANAKNGQQPGLPSHDEHDRNNHNQH